MDEKKEKFSVKFFAFLGLIVVAILLAYNFIKSGKLSFSKSGISFTAPPLIQSAANPNSVLSQAAASTGLPPGQIATAAAGLTPPQATAVAAAAAGLDLSAPITQDQIAVLNDIAVASLPNPGTQSASNPFSGISQVALIQFPQYLAVSTVNPTVAQAIAVLIDYINANNKTFSAAGIAAVQAAVAPEIAANSQFESVASAAFNQIAKAF